MFIAGLMMIAFSFYLVAADDHIARPVDPFLRWRFEMILRFMRICFLFLGLCYTIL